MNDILKQRLVGALILVALGVVFWPIIFVEPGERAAEQARIPAPPAIDTTGIAAPDREGLRSAGELEPAASEPGEEEVLMDVYGAGSQGEEPAALAGAAAPAAPAAAEPHTRSASPERPVLDKQGVPVAWILQVATVSSAGKANELRDRLLAMHEKAYVKKLERGDKVLYRVYIGPNVERAQLQKLQADIDSRFGVRSMIVRYLP